MGVDGSFGCRKMKKEKKRNSIDTKRIDAVSRLNEVLKKRGIRDKMNDKESWLAGGLDGWFLYGIQYIKMIGSI